MWMDGHHQAKVTLKLPLPPRPHFNLLYLHTRASHGRSYLWHLWCRHCAYGHRTLYVWISRAGKARRQRANTDWQTCCLMARERHSTYDLRKRGFEGHISDITAHRLARSSNRYLPTPGPPQASASVSASPLLALHGTDRREQQLDCNRDTC